MSEDTTTPQSQADVGRGERSSRSWPLRAVGWIFRTSSKLVLIALFVAGGLFIGGFLKFSTAIAEMNPQLELAQADGIVVLTGGAKRIEEALKLMKERKGGRLLISGVNDSIPLADLRKAHPNHDVVFDCCVDVESVAKNTVGNAQETAKWAESLGYKSLIVVTSGYHMPRSLLEFRRHLPQVVLVPYPVRSNRLADSKWWQDVSNLRFVLSEYTKYIGAQMRDYVSDESLAALQQAARRG
ncbi:YdcF family protein [Pseudahrensia aquimaris]|uniref:YdcF family protein n=1 Tax=Pseudahrensia aquimaris TaxID=744461 RepID=A0ABW3FB99_9HYPH